MPPVSTSMNSLGCIVLKIVGEWIKRCRRLDYYSQGCSRLRHQDENNDNLENHLKYEESHVKSSKSYISIDRVWLLDI